MTVAVGTEHSAVEVRALAKAALAPEQARRLLAIALILEGASRAVAARSTGMDRQTLRDWVHRFNAAGPSGLVDRKAPGPQRRLDPEQQRELVRCLENGPELAQDGVARWRSADPAQIATARSCHCLTYREPSRRHGSDCRKGTHHTALQVIG